MKDYVVVMDRLKTESRVTIKIKAETIREAEQKAESELPDWKVSLVAKD